MKRTLIALGVAAGMAVPMAAQAAPTVYGRLSVAAEDFKQDIEGNSNSPQFTRLVNNASRFGVKGEDSLTDDLSAVYKIEWQVGIDGEDQYSNAAYPGNTGSDLKQRDRFVGIKSKEFGTLKFGKYDSYLKQAQGNIDLFNDWTGDMQYVIAGEDRINNVIGYESPVFAGFQINLSTETQDGNATGYNGTQAQATAGQSHSVTYNNKDIGLYAAVAYNNNIYGATALYGTRRNDEYRGVVSYTPTPLPELTVNGIYVSSKDVGPAASLPGGKDNQENDWQLGASYSITAVNKNDLVVKFQYGEADADDDNSTIQDHKQWSVGLDYWLKSNTRAYVYYTDQQQDMKDAKSASNVENKAFALGLEHNF